MSNINQHLADHFSGFKPIVEATIKVTVELTPSVLLEKLAKEIHSEFERIAPYAGYKAVENLGPDDFLKYLKTLVWLRCGRVLNEEKATRPYRSLYRMVAVPVLAYQLMISIGEAIDRDFGIKFIPAYSIGAEDILAPEEVEAISDLFSRFENHGLKVVYGLPRDTEGELDFMAMCSVEGIVRSYRKSHPVYGFLAAFFEQKKLNEVTGMMCKTLYGYHSDYELYVTQLYRRLSSTQ